MKKNIALHFGGSARSADRNCGRRLWSKLRSFQHCRGNAENDDIDLAHGLSETHTVHIAMTQFADEVKEKTDGRIIINIFPNGQLGSETENLEQLQAGVIADQGFRTGCCPPITKLTIRSAFRTFSMIPKTSTTLWIRRTCRISSFPPRKTDL